MIIVDDNEGLRIDSYLSEKLELSRSKVQKLIKENDLPDVVFHSMRHTQPFEFER